MNSARQSNRSSVIPMSKKSLSISEYRQLTQKSKVQKLKDSRPWDQRYRSRAEQAFAESGWRKFEDWLQGIYQDSGQMLRDLKYEREWLRLPGGWYKPDFTGQMGHRGLRLSWRAVIEVKATKYQPSYRDSRSKIRAAAAIH